MKFFSPQTGICLLVISLFALQDLSGQSLNPKSQISGHFRKHIGIESYGCMNAFQYTLPYSGQNNKDYLSFDSRTGANQKLDSVLSFYYDFTNKLWILATRNEYIFNSDEKLISDFQYRWDNLTKQWNPQNLNEYQYDNDGNVITEYYYWWDQSINNWGSNSQKTIYTYENGNLIEILNYKLDALSGQWLNKSKTEFAYDPMNNQILLLYSVWDEINKVFLSVDKQESGYDINGNLIQTIRNNWSVPANEWLVKSKLELSYDHSNRLATRNTDDWHETKKEWIPSGREEYFYNAPGVKWDSILYHNWDATILQMKISSKDEFTYDSLDNLLKYGLYDWASNKNQWQPIWIWEYRLDYTITRDQLIGPISDFTHKLKEIILSEYNNNRLTRRDSQQYYYSDQLVSDISMQKVNEINIYPNPSSEYFMCELNNVFENATLELTDLFGRKLMKQSITAKDKISVTGISKGIYAYQIHSGQKIFKGKIFIK